MTAELEFKIIGSILLLEETHRQKIFSVIDESYFSMPQTKRIFTTLKNTFLQYPSADYSALCAALERSDQTAAVGAMSAMMSPSIAERNLDDTLAAIRDLHEKKELKNAVSELSLSSEITAGDLQGLLDRLQAGKGLGESSAEKYLKTYSDPIKLIPTGFHQLDNKLEGGLRAGTLCTIGARPSTGKTTYSINIASHNPDRRILFFSIEMTSGMIYDRIISDIADVEYSLASKHALVPESARAVLDKYPGLSIIDNISRVEKIVDLIYAEKPDIAVIDFIQIVTSEKRFTDNRQRIDHISGLLKAAAKATGCCIITLSQLTRAGKDRPTMSDLKESGGLEQDGDYVIILHRPFVNDKSEQDADPGATTVILDKNKFGNTGELRYHFNGRRQRFSEDPDGEEIQRPVSEKVTAEDDLPF